MSQLPQIRIHTAPARLVKLLALSVAMVLVGCLVLWAKSNGMFVGRAALRVAATIFGYAGIGFFGLAACYFASRLVVRRPALVIDDDGIVDNASMLSAGPVSWDEVTDVGVTSFGSQRFLVLQVRDEAELLARQNLVKRLLMRVNKGMGGAVVWVPMLAVPVSAGELLTQIGHRRAAT